MEPIIQGILDNWSLISNAPITFFLLICGVSTIAYKVSSWKFLTQIEHLKSKHETELEKLKSQISNLDDLIKLKTEQFNILLPQAEKYKEQLQEITSSDTDNLAEKAIKLADEIRHFSAKYQHIDEIMRNYERSAREQAHTEEERRKIWNDSVETMGKISIDQKLEWQRNFRVKSKILRDELLSRLSVDNQNEQLFAGKKLIDDHSYENPTNYFVYAEVAEELEYLGRKVSK